MKLLEFKMTGKYTFSAILMKWKDQYSIEGTFRTSLQDYPEDKDTPLYASTLTYKIKDKKGQDYMPMLTDNENQEIEDLLNDEVDDHIDSHMTAYKKI